jgi:Dolichyl-phosphate-mannose-protein mannosyltransferase/SEC-C motif
MQPKEHPACNSHAQAASVYHTARRRSDQAGGVPIELSTAGILMSSPMSSRNTHAFLAIALAAIFFVQALSESRIKSATSDEPPHIASGLSYVATGIFRGNPQHPPLLKELSGLSLLLAGIKWPRNPETDAFLHGDRPKGKQPEWQIGYSLIGSDPDGVMFWARLPLILIASMLPILIYFLARELVGSLAAICAAFLCTIDPNIIGQSFTVTMDVGLTTFTLLFLLTLWRYLKNRNTLRLVLCGLALGAMLCAKFSAVLLLPVAVILLLAAEIWPTSSNPEEKKINAQRLPLPKALRDTPRNNPCPCGSGLKFKACHGNPDRTAQMASSISRSWLQRGGAFLVMCFIAFLVIEAIYFFPADQLAYLHGLQQVNADHVADYPAYLAGDLEHRFVSYFAVAYLLKEPIASIFLAIAGLVLLVRSRSIAPIEKLMLLAPPVVFFLATTALADEIGIRYIMPVLPFAHILGGLALATLFTLPRMWGRWAGAVLCAWLIVADIGIYPDHLSYFNESACLLADPGKIGFDGGSRCGIYWLDDSNVDWGQGLKQLKTWLDRNAPGRTILYLSNYAIPAADYGIANQPASRLDLATQPGPGLYVVSASLVARIPEITGATDWLRRYPPAAIVGHALYVYDVPRTP